MRLGTAQQRHGLTFARCDQQSPEAEIERMSYGNRVKLEYPGFDLKNLANAHVASQVACFFIIARG